MLYSRAAFACLVLFLGASVGQAQRVLPPSPPIVRGSAPLPRTRIVVSGYFGNGYVGNGYVGRPVLGPPRGFVPFGIVEAPIGVRVVGPPPGFLLPPIDLSGVDLDRAPAPWAKDLPPREIPPPPRRRADDVAKRVEPRKLEPGMPPDRPAPVDPLAPGANPIEEGRRLTLRGEMAFRAQEYGLAAQKFSQAVDVDPAGSRAYFLLGQAYFALGKYRDAVQAIGLGLGLDPDWPKSDFHPRFHLYEQHPEDWQRHVELLEDAQARQPNNAGYLFLVAYLRWFDDQRGEAIRLFRQVRPLVADPALVDRFLKLAP